MSTITLINEFRGAYGFLSNFYLLPHPIVLGGISYPTSEHAYQALKSRCNVERARVARLARAVDAKRAGRHVSDPDPYFWDHRVDVMKLVVSAKFQANAILREQLVATGDATLQEGNRWGDTFWGVDLSTLEGDNHLGRILMEVRKELR